MKVRLLNDGGYGDMCKVRFPVVVDGTFHKCADNNGYCEILGSELIAAGASPASKWDESYQYVFINGEECEVVE